MKSTGILTEQIIPVVLEKIKFGYPEKSKFLAVFGNFAPSGVCWNGKTDIFSIKRLLKNEFFRLRPEWKKPTLYWRRNILLKIEVIPN